MPSSYNIFVDHTFLVACFCASVNSDQHVARQARATELLEEFFTRLPPPKFYTTSSEVSRAITNVFRQTGPAETVKFIDKLTSSSRPRIRIKMVSWRVMNAALEEFRQEASPYYKIGCEFLDLTSFFFIMQNRNRFEIREIVAFHDHFAQVQQIMKVTVYS